jgi:hypothetical protein
MLCLVTHHHQEGTVKHMLKTAAIAIVAVIIAKQIPVIQDWLK